MACGSSSLPALNLSTVLNPGDRKPRWRQFLALNLAGQLATAADFIELQAQSLERDTAAYTSFVQTATSQATAANPGISVLAGIVHQPARRAGRQPAADRGHPRHPIGGRRLLAQHPRPGRALPDL